jgi:hypothetical protein
MKKFLEKHHIAFIVIVLTFMAIVSILNAKNDSPIYDELAHIPAGYSYLTQHDIRLNPEHPPLLKDLAAFPLLFMHLNFDTAQPFWNENPNDAQWNAGKYFLYQAGNNPEKIVFWSRLPIILLSLILGIFIFVWTRKLAGVTAGLLALVFYAFDPNILGHNHYVTTDLGIAAFFAFALYYFIKFLKNPSWKNVFFGGIFLGLLQLTKFSSVLIFPILGLMLLVYPLLRKNHSSDSAKNIDKFKFLGEYLGKGFLAFGISLLLVWAVYQLNTFAMPTEKLPQIMQHYFHPDQRVKNQALNQALAENLSRLNEKPLMAPFADYFFGIARVFQRVAGGNVTYFMGEINSTGFWSYFPVVFLIKEPLPIIFLLFFTLALSLWQIGKKLKNIPENFVKKSWQELLDYIRTSPAEFSMLLFIFLYLLSSITGRLNIGLRHLFPIFPFLYILMAKKITEFLKKEHRREIKKFSLIILFSFLAWLILETAMAFPNYVSYFNQLVGGPKNGYHYVTDSNADWGQDLIRLRSFLAKHPEIDKIRVDYFGIADLNYYLKDRSIPWWRNKRPVEPGWYAISTLFLQESIYDKSKPDNQSYRFLKEKIPDYQVGTSLLIYYFNQAEAEKANNF